MYNCQLITAVGILGHTFASVAGPPSITRQPSGQIVLFGQAALFEVEAIGTEPLNYQWQINGTNIPNATNATISIQTATPPAPLEVSVVVTDVFGTISSRKVWLTPFTYTRFTNGGVLFTLWGPQLTDYELQSAAGLEAPIFWEIIREGTVPVNINTAPAEVLTRIPWIDDNIAQAIIQYRAGPDGIEGTGDDSPFRSVSELAFILGFPGLHASGILTTRDPPALTLGVGLPGPTGPVATNLPTQFFRIVQRKSS